MLTHAADDGPHRARVGVGFDVGRANTGQGFVARVARGGARDHHEAGVGDALADRRPVAALGRLVRALRVRSGCDRSASWDFAGIFSTSWSRQRLLLPRLLHPRLPLDWRLPLDRWRLLHRTHGISNSEARHAEAHRCDGGGGSASQRRRALGRPLRRLWRFATLLVRPGLRLLRHREGTAVQRNAHLQPATGANTARCEETAQPMHCLAQPKSTRRAALPTQRQTFHMSAKRATVASPSCGPTACHSTGA